MHRAVVLTTLVLLLLAVAGVSAAQESGIFAGGPNSDDPPGSTTQERTSFEATVAEDTMASTLPGASSEPKGGENTSEPTVVTEPTVGETEKPTAAVPGEKTLSPGSNNFGKPTNSGRGVGKPEHAGKAPNIGKPPDGDVGHPANGKPQERGNEARAWTRRQPAKDHPLPQEQEDPHGRCTSPRCPSASRRHPGCLSNRGCGLRTLRRNDEARSSEKRWGRR